MTLGQTTFITVIASLFICLLPVPAVLWWTALVICVLATIIGCLDAATSRPSTLNYRPILTKTPELDALETAWGVVANVNHGDWTKQSSEWQDAAARFRDKYHGVLDRSK